MSGTAARKKLGALMLEHLEPAPPLPPATDSDARPELEAVPGKPAQRTGKSAPRRSGTAAKRPAKAPSTPAPAERPQRPAAAVEQAPEPAALARAASDPDGYLAAAGLATASARRAGAVALNVAIPPELADALDRYTGGSRVRTRRALVVALLHAYAADAGLLEPERKA